MWIISWYFCDQLCCYIFYHCYHSYLYNQVMQCTTNNYACIWYTLFGWKRPWQQGLWGQHGAHMGPTGPRWAQCWPHEPCYLGQCLWVDIVIKCDTILCITSGVIYNIVSYFPCYKDTSFYQHATCVRHMNNMSSKFEMYSTCYC